MPAPASGRSPSLTSPSTAAPPRWRCARAGGLTRGWRGCTPIIRAAPTRSRSAARAAAVPFLPTARSRTRRGGLRRPAHGRDATARRGRPRAALDLALTPKGDLPRALSNQLSATYALIAGAEGFFTLRQPAPWLGIERTRCAGGASRVLS